MPNRPTTNLAEPELDGGLAAKKVLVSLRRLCAASKMPPRAAEQMERRSVCSQRRPGTKRHIHVARRRLELRRRSDLGTGHQPLRLPVQPAARCNMLRAEGAWHRLAARAPSLTPDRRVLPERLFAELDAAGDFLDGVGAFGNLVFQFDVGGEGQAVALHVV